TPLHTLLGLVPGIDPLHAWIAFDHALVVVVGMMGHRLDGHDVPRYDGDKWCEVLAEVTPVHGLISRGNVIVADGTALGMGLRMSECCGVDAARGSGTDVCLLDARRGARATHALGSLQPRPGRPGCRSGVCIDRQCRREHHTEVTSCRFDADEAVEYVVEH